ncbi:MAG: DCC1-like thiol-disulfide oxidoreductase family protein [Anaeromyxobacteraceae bacterium]
MSAGEHLVLFDGTCGLCSRLVRFVARRDAAGLFAFASLQGETGRAALARAGVVSSPDPSTFVLLRDWRGAHPEALIRSRGALFVASQLPRPWRWLRALAVLPWPLLDAAYRFIAQHRRRFFPPAPACALPEPGLRARLLDP